MHPSFQQENNTPIEYGVDNGFSLGRAGVGFDDGCNRQEGNAAGAKALISGVVRPD
jgi:hypothetical protein